MNAQRVFTCTSDLVSLIQCRQLADFRDYGCVSFAGGDNQASIPICVPTAASG
jgi:hypothetical protein